MEQRLDPENPWPGLAPFQEADEAYFRGREVEAEELLAQVRRELLTLLFGRSGLGKTSLLQAGLFPRLRREDGLPVYVRLDHVEGAPALREQVLAALAKACVDWQAQGTSPAAGESLWSFFHRRDAEFWSEHHRPLTPVIVLDQFEEIFTLGQEGTAARARSTAFLAELGDLVENRPPAEIRQALAEDRTAARAFDFQSAAVKLVLSFREDFLAEMEGLKSSMPSLLYNHYRLLPLGGEPAYRVVTEAGGSLVDDEIARRILRLAWTNEPDPPVEREEFPLLEIDPALLSVVCSELNQKRRQAKLSRITAELLEGADREILAGFFERGMEGLDPRVRELIEDELITEQGHRDSHALEDALGREGVTAEAIDTLVRRRLLRVDDRQSLRRLELTHDVLARVVKESRDRRRTWQAEAAARKRERVALEQQRRNRRNAVWLAVGAFVVFALMVVAGWLAWKTTCLLREAEGTRLMATADRLQETNYDISLLVNLEAARVDTSLDAQTGLLRRFESHPYLSAFLYGHQEPVDSVAFSADGKRMASASRDGMVILWDMESRQQLSRLQGHKAPVLDLTFSADGKRMASASWDGIVILWDVERRLPLARFEQKAKVWRVAFSGDGKRMASTSVDGTIVWDLERRQPLAKLETLTFPLAGLALSTDGKRMVSISWDWTPTLWDVESRQPLARLDRHNTDVVGGLVSLDGKHAAAFSSDGKYVALASWNRVILWDVESRRLLARLEGHKAAVLGVAFSADGTQLASCSQDQAVILWDVKSRRPLARLEGHTAVVSDVAFSADGKILASASRDQTILWDMQRRLPERLEGHKGDVLSVAFSADGERMASAGSDPTVILWDVESNQLLAKLEGHRDGVRGLTFSADGKFLASASWDETVILWDVKGRRQLARLEGHKGGPVSGVLLSADGKHLATTSHNRVTLWDGEKRQVVAMFARPRTSVYDLAFSADGKLLGAAARDQIVIVWDVMSHQPVAWLAGHKSAVSVVAFSADARFLASGSEDQMVIVWDVENHQPLARLEGYSLGVYDLAFSADGRLLASASGDGTLILWDVERRRQLARLVRQEGTGPNVALSPDGKRLASADLDGALALWNLDFASLAAEACRTANRNLTCDEWRSYIGADKPYRRTCAALPEPPEKCN